MSKRLNFTKESLLQIPVPGKGKREVYLDAKTAGLQVRVTDTGVKTFSVYRRVKGGPPKRITIGRFPEVTIEQARRQAAKINADIADGANPASVKRAHREELTFGELFTEYGERHGRKKRSWVTDQSLSGHTTRGCRAIVGRIPPLSPPSCRRGRRGSTSPHANNAIVI